MELVIGDKAWSSWSMRPWLVLKRAGVDFTEVKVALRRDDTAAEIARATGAPSGQVPALRDGALVIWDSLAIAEYVAELRPQARLWPDDTALRALARSASAQMHSGFAALRGEMPMDLVARRKTTPSAAVRADLDRLSQLWSHVRAAGGGGEGGFLLGGWTIADAMFTPVATRLRTYGVKLEPLGLDPWGDAYAERLMWTPEFLEWEAGVGSAPHGVAA